MHYSVGLLHSFCQGSQFIPAKWTRFLEVLLIPPLCSVASNYITAILPWSQPRYKRLDNKNRLPCFPALLKFIYHKYYKTQVFSADLAVRLLLKISAMDVKVRKLTILSLKCTFFGQNGPKYNCICQRMYQITWPYTNKMQVSNPLLGRISFFQEEVAFWKDHFCLVLKQVEWSFHHPKSQLRKLEHRVLQKHLK